MLIISQYSCHLPIIFFLQQEFFDGLVNDTCIFVTKVGNILLSLLLSCHVSNGQNVFDCILYQWVEIFAWINRVDIPIVFLFLLPCWNSANFIEESFNFLSPTHDSIYVYGYRNVGYTFWLNLTPSILQLLLFHHCHYLLPYVCIELFDISIEKVLND